MSNDDAWRRHVGGGGGQPSSPTPVEEWVVEPLQCWTIVKFDLVDDADEGEFNAWYDNFHLPEATVGIGFEKAWRTAEVEHPGNFGPDDVEFWATYQMDSLDRFRRRPVPDEHAVLRERRGPRAAEPLGDGPTDATFGRDFDFRARLTNWTRPFYAVIATLDDEGDGFAWGREQFEVSGTADGLEGFERFARDTYAPKVLGLSGVHRAYLLRFLETDLQQGADPVGNYMFVFELDSPDALMAPDKPDLAELWSDPGVSVTQVARRFAELQIELVRED